MGGNPDVGASSGSSSTFSSFTLHSDRKRSRVSWFLTVQAMCAVHEEVDDERRRWMVFTKLGITLPSKTMSAPRSISGLKARLDSETDSQSNSSTVTTAPPM